MPAGDHEAALNLDPTPASVSEARRFAERTTADWGMEQLSDDAVLVVSELVTNAVLHARTAIELRLVRMEGAVRIEVRDGSVAQVLPKAVVPAMIGASLLEDEADLEMVEELLNIGATTGRGLQLVGRLSSQWGSDPLPGGAGKTVWAVLGQAPPAGEAPPAGGAGETPGPAEERAEAPAPAAPSGGPAGAPLSHPVRLVAVPAWLALESELNLDTLVRELQMIETAGRVPESRVGYVERARRFVDDLGSALRTAQTALHAALERGDRLFDADVLVPVGSAPDLWRLIELLDEVSQFSESGVLLALAPGPAVRQFRRWYTEEIERQMGGQPPRPCPFSTLASEQAAERVTDEELSPGEAELIRRVEDDLSDATDPERLVRVFLTEAVASLGVGHASISLVSHDSDILDLVDSIGMPGGVSGHWAVSRISDDLPASEAVRTGVPVVMRTRSELFLRYPVFRGTPVVDDGAFACIPLIPGRSDGRAATGCLNLSFPNSRELTRPQLRLLCAIGSRLADALERLTVGRREEQFLERRRRFDRIVAGAPRSGDLEEVLAWAVAGLAQFFDGWCGAFVIEDNGMVRVVAARHADAEHRDLMMEIDRRWQVPDTSGAITRCIDSGEAVVFQVVPDEILRNVAVDEEHLGMLRRVAFSSFMVAPVRVGEAVGALGVGRYDSRYLTDAEVRLVSDLGRALGG